MVPVILYLPLSNCILFGLAVSLPASETPGLQPLTAHSVDYDIIQVGGSISSVWMQHLVHKELERGRGSEQVEWKCDKLLQTAQSGRPNLELVDPGIG